MSEETDLKLVQLDWIGPSKEDLLAFPRSVVREIGKALLIAQYGGKAPSAKPLRGQGPGILEVVENHRGDTYRTVYTVRFEDRVYVLHCFQKKSRKGIKTDKRDLDLVGARLKEAVADYAQRHSRKRV